MKRILTSLIGISIIMFIVISMTAISAESRMKFMSPAFAKQVCASWNTSSLPAKLGMTGSKWINKGKVKGIQTMIFWVKNCKTQRVQLTVENKDGKAICTYGGIAKTTKPDWKIYPPSYKWYKCATGVNPMWQLMGNFNGSMGVAMGNMSNFKIFFKVVGRLAVKTKADFTTGCKTGKGDLKDIKKYIKKI